jgi:uncharacterized membrane protein
MRDPGTIDGAAVIHAYTAPRMHNGLTRAELDRLAEHYQLDAQATEVLLETAAARPSPAETRGFFVRLLGIGGLLSLGASLVFFVAANWSRLAIFGRFALVELVLVACGVVALIRPPPAQPGRAALFLAFIATGALLALFGQTYQTGADVYELFLGWALLGLPIAVLGNWGATSAAWVVVLNLALLLFCGWQPVGGLLWTVLGGSPRQPALLLLAATWVNLALWFLFDAVRRAAVPTWVRRLIVSCAFGFGCWAATLGIVDSPPNAAAVLGVVVAMALVSARVLSRREDVYPLAVVMGAGIIVGLAFILETLKSADEGLLLLMAVWLIGTSTFAARFLAATARRWRTEAA